MQRKLVAIFIPPFVADHSTSRCHIGLGYRDPVHILLAAKLAYDVLTLDRATELFVRRLIVGWPAVSESVQDQEGEGRQQRMRLPSDRAFAEQSFRLDPRPRAGGSRQPGDMIGLDASGEWMMPNQEKTAAISSVATRGRIRPSIRCDERSRPQQARDDEAAAPRQHRHRLDPVLGRRLKLGERLQLRQSCLYASTARYASAGTHASATAG